MLMLKLECCGNRISAQNHQAIEYTFGTVRYHTWLIANNYIQSHVAMRFTFTYNTNQRVLFTTAQQLLDSEWDIHYNGGGQSSNKPD